MKFLPPELVRPNMIPLNIIYNSPYSFNEKDRLTIIFKDLDSGQKIVYEMEEPVIEAYIVKPEYQDYTHMLDWIEKSKCTPVKVKYRTRWHQCAKKLGLENSAKAKTSPYIFGVDIPIENYYLMQFVKEYPTTAEIKLSIGFLDIENDVIRCNGFPSYGEAPINAVTYINKETRDVYTLVLCKDNIPVVRPDRKSYPVYEKLKTNFYKQVDDLRANMDSFKKECEDRFNPLYGELNYILLTYNDEDVLLEDLMKIIHNTDNDYIGIWNLPYDMGNIMKRPSEIGMSPAELISDKRFSKPYIKFEEDKSPIPHKRRHTCITSTVPTFVDDMVHYAGIRSIGGKLPSTKLTAIAKSELGDEKYDYSEVSDFKYLFYRDLRAFILYNIKDVLLMLGISDKTNDMDTIYSRMYQTFVFPKEAFVTTRVVWHSLIQFIDERGFTFGTNRNKGNRRKRLIDYSEILGDSEEYQNLAKMMDELLIDEDEDVFIDLTIPDEEIEYDADGNPIEPEDEKFAGAYVANTLHMQSTNFKIMGVDSKYVHEDVADLDVESEYPTAVNIGNKSNGTLVGKVFLENPNIEIPIPEGFVFRGDDLDKYKMDVSNFMLEMYTQKDVFNFGSTFLNLPNMEEIMSDVGSIVNKKGG